jgi:hypothetical protein
MLSLINCEQVAALGVPVFFTMGNGTAMAVGNTCSVFHIPLSIFHMDYHY